MSENLTIPDPRRPLRERIVRHPLGIPVCIILILPQLLGILTADLAGILLLAVGVIVMGFSPQGWRFYGLSLAIIGLVGWSISYCLSI